jgi:hypothetical protein
MVTMRCYHLLAALCFVFSLSLVVGCGGGGGGGNSPAPPTTYTPTFVSGNDTYRATYGGQQGGTAYFGITHASIWSGGADSEVDLHDPAHYRSFLWGMGPGQQVGYSQSTPGFSRAALWKGTAASYVDLHPASAVRSAAYDTDGTIQGGEADGHAAFWTGTAASYVDLHPTGAAAPDSIVLGVGGGKQIGNVGKHAYLWSGSPNSGIDLHPAGFTETLGQAIDGNDQVGTGFGHPQYPEAAAIVWHGSATNYTVLNPPGVVNAQAWGAGGGKQVGWYGVGDNFRACVWSGTAASMVDLHAFLPPGYEWSQAYAVDPVTGDIVGYARDNETFNIIAVIWHPNPK